MKVKDYTPKGVQMDANFASHRALCARCRGFDQNNPASAIELCLEGSILWKRENIKIDRTPGPKDEFRGTREQVRLAMRYKE